MQLRERFQLPVRAWLALLVGALSTCACGDGASPAAPEGGLPPLSAECDSTVRCKEGESCLDRRCVALCKRDDDCATRERCAREGTAQGLCVAGDLLPVVDPCAGKYCAAEAPACHPVAGTCVACTGAEHCPAATPVCDRGRGECVAAVAALCAACESDADCGESDAGVPFSCVATDQPYERVCLPSGCGGEGDCPPGFACSPARSVCFPRRASCTAYRNGIAGVSCSDALACSALGVAARSIHEGTCVAGACALGCEQTSDCPGALVCSEQACGASAGPDAAAPSSRGGEGGV
jgi:hypothetical protein